MSYRPITDCWWLARAKLKNGEKYYGAYLGGFVERARALLGCRPEEPVLHVCGGKAKLYPYSNPGRAVGPNDCTLDLDESLNPDFLQDARDPFPTTAPDGTPWGAILMDPPYSIDDSTFYKPGMEVYPKPNLLVKNALNALQVGRRVGIIHYIVPQHPKKMSMFVACVGVFCGFNNRARAFSVFERTPLKP